ncbi:MAG TPA: hypothetical protein VKT53_07870 [Candidatus Acidoferrum sp.]|nr:hypothetical protein [Candidatus Acidoferrum sp.]
MKFLSLLVVGSLCCFLSAGDSQEFSADSGLIVHEWGTFTSIAGAKGEAVVWTPQAERDDLPAFVEHLRNNRFKGGLQGTVRMETPVLYFYANHPATVSVHVSFSRGLLTEWYPHAVVPLTKQQLSNPLPAVNAANGELQWNSVQVNPGGAEDFPKEPAASRYYAARETLASPVTVNSPAGRQQEKFLFYRGVSSFDVPVTALPMNDGRILVSNSVGTTTPTAILFERRGTHLGYRILGPVQYSSIVDPPELSSDIGTLSRELEKILVTEGLHPDEARAMLTTWNDSWFEEGTRLLYVVPRAFVDRVLPLTIHPAPASTTRVFVGRMEIVTPATEQAVESAFSSGDRTVLVNYGRFLAPILQVMLDRNRDSARTERLTRYLNSAYSDAYALLHQRPKT